MAFEDEPRNGSERLAQPPQMSTTADDSVNDVLEGALSDVPRTGGALAELLRSAITPPIERRRDEWFALVAVALDTCAKHINRLRPENLARNDEFLTLLLEASQQAARTHEREKHEALCNAVLNTALGSDTAFDKKQVFVRLAGSLAPVHLRVLRALTPDSDQTFSRDQAIKVIATEVPELAADLEFQRAILAELTSAGLLKRRESLAFIDDDGRPLQSIAPCDFGRQFLAFIRAPLPPR